MSRWGAWPRRMLLLALVVPSLLHIALSSSGAMASVGEAEGWIGAALVAASGLPHALIYAALLAMFGASLRAGREPLVTGLSRTLGVERLSGIGNPRGRK
jgi:hypothetical protein